jgi:hypothetical protein
METVLKTVVPATVPWVRIPPLPPAHLMTSTSANLFATVSASSLAYQSPNSFAWFGNWGKMREQNFQTKVLFENFRGESTLSCVFSKQSFGNGSFISDF